MQVSADSETHPEQRRIDWPIIYFFLLAFALAWCIQWLIVMIAGGAGLSVDTMQASAENLNYELLADKLSVSPWLVYGFFGAESGLLVYLFTRGSLGEELGLRGFALPRLQQRYSPFKSASIIGLFWALWHLPVLWDRGPVPIVLFLLVAVCLSYIFTWLFNASRGSLIPVLLFHTIQNAEEIWEVVFPNITSVNWELTSTLLLIGIAFGVVLWKQSSKRKMVTSLYR